MSENDQKENITIEENNNNLQQRVSNDSNREICDQNNRNDVNNKEREGINEDSRQLTISGLRQTRGGIEDELDLSDFEMPYTREDAIYCEVKNYIVGEYLGKGSFAIVKEFVDKNTFKRYAAKIITKNFNERKNSLIETNVKKEMNLVRKLNHKNIMKIIEFIETKDNFFMVLEYCSGVLQEFLGSEDELQLKKLPKSQSHL
jgi:serine/threonine protein kinase